jgi:hypothetical protein
MLYNYPCRDRRKQYAKRGSPIPQSKMAGVPGMRIDQADFITKLRIAHGAPLLETPS